MTAPTDDFPLPPSAHAALRGATCLITGGAGFIGSHLAHALLARQARVRVIDDLSGGFEQNLPAGVEFIRASVLDEAELARASRDATYVFHHAAMVSVPQSVERPLECVRINIEGTQRVIDAARLANVKRVIFASSAAAYGNHPTLPSREDHPADPWSHYATSKLAGEMLMLTGSRCFGLSTVSLRYFNIFGTRQNPLSPYAAVISRFAHDLRHGVKPTIFGDGLQTRDFTHVGNVVLANLLAATSERSLAGEVLNIGTGVQTSLREALEQIARVLKVEARFERAAARPGDIRDSLADISRARQILGYEPMIDFAIGLQRTLTT